MEYIYIKINHRVLQHPEVPRNKITIWCRDNRNYLYPYLGFNLVKEKFQRFLELRIEYQNEVGVISCRARWTAIDGVEKQSHSGWKSRLFASRSIKILQKKPNGPSHTTRPCFEGEHGDFSPSLPSWCHLALDFPKHFCFKIQPSECFSEQAGISPSTNNVFSKRISSLVGFFPFFCLFFWLIA